MNLKQLIDLIESKNEAVGIDINQPALTTDIFEFEKQIGFQLPKEFKDFYLICNGFGCNEDIFNMTPLQDITRHKQDYGKNWFYFSEYMIYSDMWGVRIASDGKYEIFNGSYPSKTMTTSLIEFLTRFLKGNVFEKGGLYDWQEELGIK